MHQFQQLGIIGTGLLGASVGLGAKAAGLAARVVGSARSQATLDAARHVGAIDAGTTDPGTVAAESDLLVIAVPLGHFDAIFKQIAPHDHSELVMTDVGSTKLNVLALAAAHLPDPSRFVGAHPMAGSEKQGPEAATAQLCRDKPCIITPAEQTSAHALQRVEQFWQALGMRLIHMSAREHDEKTANVSHLPHLAAVMLTHLAMQRGGLEVASSGFRDTTRLASSNPPMRADILQANAPQVRQALASLRQQLDKLDELLAADDRAGLLAMLKKAQHDRDAWLDQRK